MLVKTHARIHLLLLSHGFQYIHNYCYYIQMIGITVCNIPTDFLYHRYANF